MSKIEISDNYNIENVRNLLKGEIGALYNVIIIDSKLSDYDFNSDNEELDKLNDILDGVGCNCKEMILTTVIDTEGININNPKELDEFYDTVIDYRMIGIITRILENTKLGPGNLANHFNTNGNKKYFSNAHKTKDVGLRLQQYLFNLPYSDELSKSGEIELFTNTSVASVKYDSLSLSYDHGEWNLVNEDGYVFTIKAPTNWSSELFKQQMLIIYSLLTTGSTKYANDTHYEFSSFLNKMLAANCKVIGFKDLIDEYISNIKNEILSNVRNQRKNQNEKVHPVTTNEGE